MKKITFIILASVFLLPGITSAATITGTTAYAWSDVMGWINFNPTNGNVTITNTAVTGYAWSAQYGWINLAPTNGGVVNDGNGTLSGSAWGANTGWIDFTGVSINSSGVFTGHTASSTLAGTITFSCANCLVTTSWRPGGTTASSSPVPTSTGSGSGGGGGSISGTSGPVSSAPTVPSAPSSPGGIMPSSGAGINESPTSNSDGQYNYSGTSSPAPLLHSSASSSVSSTTIYIPTKEHWWDVLTHASRSIQIIGSILLLFIILLVGWRIVKI